MTDPKKQQATIEQATPSQLTVGLNQTGPAAPWQEIIALGIDLARSLEAAVKNNRLSPVERLILYLHFAEGWEMEEIAHHLDMSYSQVRRSLKRALKAIQDTGLLKGYE